MNGVDHVEPHTAIPALIEKLSAIPGQRARHSTLPDYVAAVRTAVETERPALETIVGELRSGTDYANLLPGVLSARVYLKQQNAHVQTLLESYAEPLSVFASHLAPSHVAPSHDLAPVAPRTSHLFSYPSGQLRHAWKTLLQNHPHDSICGCSIDAVHEENMTRFARAGQVGDAVVDLALDAIADAVPAPPSPGVIRAVVVNTDAVERAQVVEAFIDLPIDSAEPWRKVDAQALDRPVVVLAARIDDHRASPAPMASRRIPDSWRGGARHARDEPLRNAVGAERAPPAPALVGAGAAAVRLRGIRSDDRDRPTPPAPAADGS